MLVRFFCEVVFATGVVPFSVVVPLVVGMETTEEELPEEVSLVAIMVVLMVEALVVFVPVVEIYALSLPKKRRKRLAAMSARSSEPIDKGLRETTTTESGSANLMFLPNGTYVPRHLDADRQLAFKVRTCQFI